MIQMKKQKENIPFPASAMVNLYNASPRVCFPGTKLDVGFMLCWMVVFIVARLVTFQILVHHYAWPAHAVGTMNVCSCIVSSVLHATNLIPLTYICMTTQTPYNPSASLKSHPQWWQDTVDAVLQLSMGYMMYDTAFLCLRAGDDNFAIFLAHHILCFFYMGTCRIYGAGHSSAMTCMFFGELTNHFFNLSACYGHAEAAGMALSPFWQNVQQPNEVFLALLYLPDRFIISPILGIYMSWNLLTSTEGRKYVPLVVRLIWVSTMFLVIYGSIGHGVMYYNVLKEFFLDMTTSGGQEL